MTGILGLYGHDSRVCVCVCVCVCVLMLESALSLSTEQAKMTELLSPKQPSNMTSASTQNKLVPLPGRPPLHLVQENYLITQSLSHLICQMGVKVL